MESLYHLLTYDSKSPMIFSTGLFLVVFTLFFGGYVLIQQKKDVRLLYVTLFSIFFYYKSSGWYVLVLLAGMLWDYGMGHLIHAAGTKALKKVFLILSVSANLGMLGYFKYTNFLLDAFSALQGHPFEPLKIILPAGISFFTFQALSYTIDVYRGKIAPVKSLLDYAFFVTFFPQLVAGPIVRAVDFIPQIRKHVTLTRDELGRALLLIIGGLFKKAIISDYIATNFVDRIFDNPTLYSGFENLMGVYGYTLQIYCDFSGYSDMAIGIALLMGFTLPLNFDSPYQSEGIQAFWRRWHISLSTWLRDYLYIALGGNRKGSVRTYVNLFLTMLLGGLWHGANWVFILWGALHGAALAIDRALTSLGKAFANPALRALVVLAAVHLGGAITTFVAETEFDFDFVLGEQFYRANALVFCGWVALYLFTMPIDWLLDRADGIRKYEVGRIAAIIMTFHFVAFCWIFFRAGAPGNPAPMHTAYEVLLQMATTFKLSVIPEVLAGYQAVFWLMLLGYALHFVPRHLDVLVEKGFARAPWPVQALVLASVIFVYTQIRSAEVQPFIYFQF